jgi:hypothetical protein
MKEVTMNDHNPAAGRMLEEIVDLSAGLGILLLPMSALMAPGLLLFFVLPAALLALPFVLLAALVLPPVLLARKLFHKSPV